ncbi:RHS repeat-associated core domain-containing protein [Cereibacter sphaeroides]|uniref:YD repeat protein n=2 Tax=Cereibacter sphaeroides TaxID=1063 RepID=Q3HKD8_CERS4|nr:RHS repeat-associated core domain-containing protein [Cereibacter sphaeroides]ABA81806.1 YD repeat protein [Cereibacter sphaeroides 2.4.1]AMJ49949.1 sugar-binding protein [Cereibacter sphaeroides]ANS36598.1 sugar-binding protein [Cereibacter sphaeroides]ATN65723.1 sugar-binding protein [Cereibacter sphaeroides]AXC63841.1 sugar-binding protein [Cereibacter sphaeroides 2.4.1]
MTSSQYQGSQAYNQSLQSNEYINRNTGSLVVSLPLVQLRGITDAIGLSLTLGYSAGASGQLGLPQGWGWGLPFVAAGQSLTVEGKTFVIDPSWTDSSGYQSGLRYLNDHGRLFQTVVPPQPVPGGGGTYGFMLRYDDGSISYFDATGKLIAHADLYGNMLRYAYTNPLGDVFQNSLASITDSFGQVVTFGYSGGTIVLTLPDGSSVTVAFSSQGVQHVTNQIGAVTAFSYASASGTTVVGAITYPTGMTTTLAYTGLRYIDAGGNSGTRPAVQSMTRTGPGGAFLDRSDYSYGTASGGNTYTGATAGYRMGTASDGLMDSNNTAYQYDVLEQRRDAGGALIAANRVFFNYLHCPLTEHAYLVDANGHAQEAHRTSYTYDIVTDAHARSVNMNKPVTTVHSVYDAAGGTWSDNSQADVAYDLYGKITSSSQYDLSSGRPRLTGQRTHSFLQVAWGGEMPQRTDYVDAVTGQTTRIDYGLTADQKSIAATTVSTQAAGAGSFAPYKTKTFQFDPRGCQTGWTLTWAQGYSGPEGSVASVGEQTSYSYDAASHQLTVDTTDANGHTRVAVFDMRLPGGPCLSQTKPGGARRSYAYDPLARLMQETDPLGDVTTHAYTLAGNGGGGTNTSTVTQSNGYVLCTTYDAKGRAVLMMDNGDPTQSTPSLSRTLRRVSFNALDLKASETDATEQTLTISYDALGRQIALADALGNQSTTIFDDAARTVSTSMNGDLRTVITRDGLGNTIQTDTHADSGSPQAGQVQRVTSAYDGFGQVVTETHFSITGGNVVQNSVKTFAYTPDGNSEVVDFTGTPATAALQATRCTTTQRDLNGNPILVTRNVSYNGAAQPLVVSETLTYDPVGNLIEIRNQAGQIERLSYTTDSALQSRTRYDGTQTTYAYDAAGQVLSETTNGQTRTFAYLSNGRIDHITDPSGTLRYAYSLDGTASSVTYPDGKTLSLTKDATSRVVSMTLPDGTAASYSYNTLNQIIAQTMGGVTLSNTWGTANHANGVLLKQVLGGATAQTTQFGYDGFGANDSVAVTDGAGIGVLSAAATRDGWRNLVSLTLASAVNTDPSVNVAKTMSYDGLKQLVGITLAPSGGGSPTQVSYAYDGAANVLTRTRNGQQESFAYNALNQITSGAAAYDANGRMVRDVDGSTYGFDPLDRLTNVGMASGPSMSNSYGPQGALASVIDGSTEDRFYPLAGTMVSVAANAQSGTPEWHGLMWAGQMPVARVSAGSVTAYAAASKSVYVHRTSASSNALAISAYGTVTPQSALDRANSFNWNSQFTDPVSNLTYLRARWYNPETMRFLSLDPRITMNRYAYAMGNPIANSDPLGQSWEEIVGLIAGAIVGIGATVLTGGVAGAAAAAVFGTECVAASIGAGALAGAVGSVAGDLTSAAISGQKITGARVGIDLLSGAVGGAVGAGLGGAAGRVAMRGALNAGWSQAAITRVGLITSGAIGGLTGAAASAGVTSVAYQQPFFSTGNIVSMAVGFGAGAGGGILMSGAYLGKINAKIIPVPIGEDELHLITPAVDTRGAVGENERLLVMAPQPEAETSANGFQRRPGGYKYAMRLDFGEGEGEGRPLMAPGREESVDTIAGHGAGNTIFASVDVSGDGAPDFVRPISGRNFARYLVDEGWREREGPIKLMSCFGAFRNARVIADTLGRDVWAGYPELDRYSFTGWVRFPAPH